MGIHLTQFIAEAGNERIPDAWQINVKVEEQEATTLLIATSYQLPGLVAVATCENDLADRLPTLIEEHCQRRFGQRVHLRCAAAPDPATCSRCCRNWVAVPTGENAATSD